MNEYAIHRGRTGKPGQPGQPGGAGGAGGRGGHGEPSGAGGRGGVGGAGGVGSDGPTLRGRLSSPRITPMERMILILGAISAMSHTIVEILNK